MISGEYVTPLNPKRGESLSLSIAIAERVDEVTLIFMEKDQMREVRCIAQGKRYTASLTMPNEGRLCYFFRIRSSAGFYFYSCYGLSRSYPSYNRMFTLRATAGYPEWVQGAACYQIYPDRFCAGDESVGAKDGEYDFDGGSVCVHPFGEKPCSFEKGRCLDFHNGDLKGIEKKLDYLQGYGFDTIYVNPIFSSRTTHRYDATDFFHVDEKLGGDAALSSLTSAMHLRGMRLIVDISINHTGIDHPWFQKALSDPESEEREFYYFDDDGTARYWQGVRTLPQLNFHSKKLRQLLYAGKDGAMRKFLRPPFSIDGWRLDVAPELGRTNTDDLCLEIWREVRSAVKEENENAYLVGEDWIDPSPFMEGDAWDASMNYFGCSRPLRSWWGEADRFLSSGWGYAPESVPPFTGTELASALMQGFSAVPSQMLFLQMNLFDSHDTPRLSTKAYHDFDIFKGLVYLEYLLPGFPSTYYGDEVGLPGPYGSVEDCRYPMEWDEKRQDRRFVSLYRQVGEIREKYRTLLSDGAYRVVYADEETLLFARYKGPDVLLVALNRAKEEKHIAIRDPFIGVVDIILARGENRLWHQSRG